MYINFIKHVHVLRNRLQGNLYFWLVTLECECTWGSLQTWNVNALGDLCRLASKVLKSSEEIPE